ncbi:hypothetical protein [Streptomyces sp. NPDC048650]|uniref:hypothetical protein n=1 Tax=Streptomyces sp. NPDC048650 TaxID=3365583 RepID=UPI00371D88D5
MFDGIDDVDVEAVTAAFGTVEVVVRGRVADCPRRTFVEPFSQLAAPYARFTSLGSTTPLEQVGLALAGRAGARCG